MANARHKNSIFVDATGDITVDGITPIINGILITPSAANSQVVIKETSSSGTIKIDVKVVAVESMFIDFSKFGGIQMTTTFNITTLTNITSVILYGTFTAPVGKAI